MLDFTIELHRTNELLLRIATALERAVPPVPEERIGFRKRGVESMSHYGDEEKLWAREELYNLIHPQGLAPAQEQELLDRAMTNFGKPVNEIDDQEGPWS